MLKNFSKNYLSFLFLLFVLVAADSTNFAQKKGEIVSGEYESLILAVNAQGELTGYFEDGTGDDGKGHSQFTCAFYISGSKISEGFYQITTWYPSDRTEFVTGNIEYTESGGKPTVNLKLEGEHGGCGMVAPKLKNDNGIDFELTKSEKWQEIRVVSSAKSYLYISAEAKTPQKIRVVKSDVIRLLQTKNNRAEIVFVNKNGKTTKGWINLADLFDIAPPRPKGDFVK